MAELDRVITLRLYPDQTFSDLGGPIDRTVWARRIDTQSEPETESGVTRVLSVREYRLRWRADTIGLPTRAINIIEGSTKYNVTAVREPDPRDRFMHIEVVAEG